MNSKLFWSIFALCFLVGMCTLWNLLPALFSAILFAYVMEPVHEWTLTKIPWKKPIIPFLSAWFWVSNFLGLFLVPLFSLAAESFMKAKTFLTDGAWRSLHPSVPRAWEWTQQWAASFGLELDVESVVEKVKSILEQLASQAAGTFGTIVENTSKIAFDFILMFVLTIYFLMEGKKIRKKYLPLIIPDIALLNLVGDTTSRTIKAVVTSNILVSLFQSFLIFIFFIITGVPDPLLWSGLSFFLSFIPVVGTLPVTFGAMLYCYSQNSLWRVVILAIGVVVVGTSDNLLRPYLSKGKIHLGFVPLMLAYIGGLSFFGFYGVILGPLSFSLILSFSKMRSSPSHESAPIG